MAVRVGDVADAIRGITFSSTESNYFSTEDSIACLTTSGVQEEVNWGSRRFVPVARVRRTDQLLQVGDILMSTANSKELVGKTSFIDHAPFPCTFGAFVTVIRPKSEIVPFYLFQMLRSRKAAIHFQLRSSETTNISNLRFEDILNFEIPYPSLQDQRRIAAILSAADGERRRRRYIQSAQSDRFAQDLFVEMFGDLYDERWKFTPLGQIAEVVSGVTKGQDYNGRFTIRVPYLRVANVQDGHLDLSEIKMIDALPSDVEDLRLEPGDVLMTEGGDFDKLGRGTIWRGEIANCIHQNHIFRARLDPSVIDPIVFAQLLRTRYAKAYFLWCSKQTTNLASINMTQLRALPVPLLSSDLQTKYVELAWSFETGQHQQRELTHQTDHLFQSLLDRAFRGEL